MSDYKLPMQPIQPDQHGTPRFVSNRIVRQLLTVASGFGYDLNQIAIDACNGKFTDDEQAQLAQLIGYSVSGFGDLSYARCRDDELLDKADQVAAGITGDYTFFGRAVPGHPGRVSPQLGFGPRDDQDGSTSLTDRDGMTIFLSKEEALELASLIIKTYPLDALGQV